GPEHARGSGRGWLGARHRHHLADAGEVLAAFAWRRHGCWLGAGRLSGARSWWDDAGGLVAKRLVNDAGTWAAGGRTGLPVVRVDGAGFEVGDPSVRHAGGPQIGVDEAFPGCAVEPHRLLGHGVRVRDLMEEPAAGERTIPLLALAVDEHTHGGAHIA